MTNLSKNHLTPKTTNNMQQSLEENKSMVDEFLEIILPPSSDKLTTAMRYTTFNGGKRLRATLVFVIGKLFKTSDNLLQAAAASIELIHGYSLVHDDLPAMDDDDLRRGKPTCHKQFDEATAILVGDALQTLAFEVLANHEFNPVADHFKLQMITTIAKAAGLNGMIKGQMQDLAAESKHISASQLQELHKNKTGQLFTASLLLGAHASECENSKLLTLLTQLGNTIGLLFQIQDDILDETASTTQLGKPAGSDAKNSKTTYVSLFGVEKAKTMAESTYKEAIGIIDSLETFTEITNSEPLRKVISFFIERKY